jgi:uncharacterized membrane protein YhiD involved in acid resistance
MGKIKTFEEFLTTQSVKVPVGGLVLNLILAAILSLILSFVYARYGNSLSNRRAFARNFMLVTMTTTLIITVVKSSLALSLGLVGALSIVRFRAAIKEPEELSYMFLAIAIGLGLGADQRLITVVAFVIITGIIWLKHLSYRKEENQNLYLTVTSQEPHKMELEQIVETLKEHCKAVSMKRFDETRDSIEASFLIEFDDFDQLQRTKSALREQSDSIKITFLDNKGIFQ